MEKENNIITRIGESFNNEIETIKKERIKYKIDKKKTSTKKITNLIIRHNLWSKIKDDTINYVFPKDKKGLTTVSMFFGFFVIVMAVVFLGIFFYIFSTVTNNLMIDVDVGQVNLMTVTNETMGELNRGFSANVDNIGIAIILGMILVMLLNGYFFGGKYHRLFIVVDIFILIFVFIFAVYLAQSYNTLIHATEELNIYINDMPKTSTFIINLPIYVSIIGIIIIIVSYLIIPKAQNEVIPNVYGY